MHGGMPTPDDVAGGDLTLAARLFSVDQSIIHRMDASRYVHDLLHTCLKEKLGGSLPSTLTSVQQFMLAQSGEQVGGLALRLGAVCYAPAILALIEGEDVRALAQKTTLFVMQDAAWGYGFLPPSGGVSTSQDLASAIQTAGIDCLWAWCAQQPKPVCLRVQAMLPAQELPVQLPLADPAAMVDTFVREHLCGE